MRAKLDAEILQELQKLPAWKVVNGKLRRSFDLGDFIAAFGFMTQVARQAEMINHHPEWSNIYKTVVIDLTTHSQGRITPLDLELAGKIDVIFEEIVNAKL
ncbi:MAG: 4a-hydroxytetrahydrobiopterin dehydratase [Candidatus Thioglobus sp.]|nr:4a-hydroxytetrahydrobiopterin dehydratase [Candidatus Thioglobus sp.]